jgi:chromosome segregation ATPase
MLRSFGVQQDKFECFIADLQNRCCNELRLPLDRIAFYIANLAELSDNVPVSEITNYISQKVDEKKAMEQKIKELEDQIEELQTKKSELEGRTASAVQKHAITQEKLEWYSTIKEELEKYGIPVHDISKVVVIANNVAKLFGYDNQKIIDALSNLQTLKNEYELYEGLVRYNRNECSI